MRSIAKGALIALLTTRAAAALVAQVQETARPPLTFDKDVAPIIWSRCAGCHRPNASGPFSLITYDDVKRRGTLIASVTARRVMPPWKPLPGKGDFADARRLTDEELATLQQWIAEGMPAGSGADLPTLPTWESGWQLGTPDLVISMADAYDVPPEGAGGGDVFRTFVLSIPIDRARYVRGIEFRPDNPRVVHHANIGIDRTRSSRSLDGKDGAPGYVGGMVQDARYPEGQMLGWTPGQAPHAVPAGMQWRLEPGSDLVAQMHLQPTGKHERLKVSVGFFFTDEPPSRTPLGLRLGSETIDIPAGAGDYAIEDSYVLPVDVELLAIQPHAHNLARRMSARANLRDGTVLPLIEIDDWDFRWQDVYRYRTPVALARGTTITMRYFYDNSAGNARNPHHPPSRVVWGQNTSDEMGDLWLQIAPRDAADLAALTQDVRRKASVEDLAAYAKLLNADSSNPLRHDAVASLAFDADRVDEAIDHYERSLELNPASAPTHYNLGIAYAARGRRDDARAEFQKAVDLDPDYAQAHNNLGAMLSVSGDIAGALQHLRRAVQLRPDNVEAHTNFGTTLSANGHPAEAAAQFREALALRPDSVPALAGLAWIRATSWNAALRDGDQAVTLAEAAAARAGRHDLSVLDALAAAYASVGRFDDAMETAITAAAQADSVGMTDVAARFRERVAIYRRHQPYRVPPPQLPDGR
jgi:Flp pilus assembly protein TadD